MIKVFEGGVIHPHMEQGMSAATHDVPDSMQAFLSEPAFITDQVTCLLWNERNGSGWHAFEGSEDAGEHWFELLIHGARYYHAWAEDYYEIELDMALIERVFELESLTRELVGQLNDELDWTELQEDIDEINYPVG